MRQQKYGKLIQKELGDIFQKMSREHFEGAFITVTQARITPDLSICRVYLTFLLVKDVPGLMLKIQEFNKQIRQALAARIRYQARIIPELHFYHDDTDEVAANVDALFKQIDIPPADKEYFDEEDYKED